MAERQLEGLMSVTLEKIKEMTGSNTIIGEPIRVDGATILPVSKVTFGFAGGGFLLASGFGGFKFRLMSGGFLPGFFRNGFSGGKFQITGQFFRNGDLQFR